MAKILTALLYENGIVKLLKGSGIAEIKRHASVSTKNRHYCKDCFCCACLDWLKKNHVEI